MYRSAIVALKPENANIAVSRLAIELAVRRQLQLSGIVVVDPELVAPAESVPLGAGAFKVHRDAALREQAEQRARQALDVFAQRVRAAGIECTTALREGTLGGEIARAVAGADLLLVGHTTGTEATGDTRDRSPLHVILKHCARPCLVVPGLANDATEVVVAYDESIQAARAMHDFAMSGLWADRTAHVVSMASDSALAEEAAGRGAAFLKLHHIAAIAHPIVARHDAARHILDFVRQSNAGLLVMGALGQTHWRDFVFGSVTRTILRSINVPVFLSH